MSAFYILIITRLPRYGTSFFN